MAVLYCNFALGCGPKTDYPYIHIIQYMLERKNAKANEVLEPVTFLLVYSTIYIYAHTYIYRPFEDSNLSQEYKKIRFI